MAKQQVDLTGIPLPPKKVPVGIKNKVDLTGLPLPPTEVPAYLGQKKSPLGSPEPIPGAEEISQEPILPTTPQQNTLPLGSGAPPGGVSPGLDTGLKLSPDEELEFQDFWNTDAAVLTWKNELGIPEKTPDDPQDLYDYRKAWKAGDAPSPNELDEGRMHWSSVGKLEGHPTRWKQDYVEMFGVDPDEEGVSETEGKARMGEGQIIPHNVTFASESTLVPQTQMDIMLSDPVQEQMKLMNTVSADVYKNIETRTEPLREVLSFTQRLNEPILFEAPVIEGREETFIDTDKLDEYLKEKKEEHNLSDEDVLYLKNRVMHRFNNREIEAKALRAADHKMMEKYGISPSHSSFQAQRTQEEIEGVRSHYEDFAKKQIKAIGARISGQFEEEVRVIPSPEFKTDELQKKYQGLIDQAQTTEDQQKVRDDYQKEFTESTERINTEYLKSFQGVQGKYMERYNSAIRQISLDYESRIGDILKRLPPDMTDEQRRDYSIFLEQSFATLTKDRTIKMAEDFKNLPLYVKVNRALAAGSIDVLSSVGGGLSWFGAESLGNRINDFSAEYHAENPLPAPVPSEGLKFMSDSNWWIVNGVRTLPMMGVLAAISIPTGGYAGAFAARFVAGSAAKRAIAMGVGGTSSWAMETFMEAGSAYNEAILAGDSKEIASEKASNVAQIDMATLPLAILSMAPFYSKRFGIWKALAVQAPAGAVEEIIQEYAQAKQRHPQLGFMDFAFSQQGLETGVLGAVLSGSMAAFTGVADPVSRMEDILDQEGETLVRAAIESMFVNDIISEEEYNTALADFNSIITKQQKDARITQIPEEKVDDKKTDEEKVKPEAKKEDVEGVLTKEQALEQAEKRIADVTDEPINDVRNAIREIVAPVRDQISQEEFDALLKKAEKKVAEPAKVAEPTTEKVVEEPKEEITVDPVLVYLGDEIRNTLLTKQEKRKANKLVSVMIETGKTQEEIVKRINEEFGINVKVNTRIGIAEKIAAVFEGSLKKEGIPPVKSGIPFGLSSEAIGKAISGIPKKIKAFWQKHMTSRGDLPSTTFEEKIIMGGRIGASLKDIEYTARDFRKAVKEEFGVTAEKLTDEQKSNMDNALKGDQKALESIPEKTAEQIVAMRNQIDALSREMIREGIVEGDMEIVFDENLGTYVNRSYQIFDDPENWKHKVSAEIKNKAKAFIRGQMPTETEEGIEGIINEILYKPGAASAIVSGSKLGSKDLSILKQRKQIAPEIRALMGEYTDPLLNYAKSVTKMAHLIEKSKFLNEIREDGMGVYLFEKPTPDHHAKIAAEGSQVMSPLNGLYTTPEIKEAFEAMDKAASDHVAFMMYMKVNGFVKYSKTILSLMTHVRNLLGNSGFALANGHITLGSPRKMANAIQVIMSDLGAMSNKGFQEKYKEYLRLGVVDESVRAGELRDIIQDAVGSNGDVESLMDSWIVRVKKKLTKGIENAYKAEDDVWKIFAFEHEKARYQKVYPEKSEEEINEIAAKIVRNTYPTYSLVPDIVKQMRRFPILGTFVSFPAEVIRTSYNTVEQAAKEIKDPRTRKIGIQRAAGISAAITTTGAMSLASMAFYGMSAEEEDDLEVFLADWSKNTQKIYTRRPGDGKYHYIDLGYSDPHSYLKAPFKAMLRGDDMFDSGIDAMSELAEPFLGPELLADRIARIHVNKRESGRPVYNEQGSAPDKLAESWEYLAEALEPGTIRSFRRIWKGVHGETNVQGKSYDPVVEVFALFSGQRAEIADIPTAFSFKVSRYTANMNEARSIYLLVKNRTNTTQEEKDEAYKKSEAARKRLFNEMHEVYQAALRLNVKRSELSGIIKGSGGSVRIMSGIYTPSKK